MSRTPHLGSPDASTEASGGGSPEPVAPSSFKRRYGRWLALAIGVAVVALAYGLGRIQGAVALSAAEAEHMKTVQAGHARLVACEADRDLLEARRSLSLVALSLDRRNFGVAETHRRAALKRLEQPSVTGMTKVGDLATTVRALDLAVDPDPGAQRERVIAVSEGLDGVLVARNSPAPEPLVRADQP